MNLCDDVDDGDIAVVVVVSSTIDMEKEEISMDQVSCRSCFPLLRLGRAVGGVAADDDDDDDDGVGGDVESSAVDDDAISPPS